MMYQFVCHFDIRIHFDVYIHFDVCINFFLSLILKIFKRTKINLQAKFLIQS